MESYPNREHLRQPIIERVNELLADVEYQQDTPGYTERRGIKNIFGQKLLRRAYLFDERYGEEIVIRESSVRLLGKTKRTRLTINSMRQPGGDGRGGYAVDWSYRILDDPEVLEDAELLRAVVSRDAEVRIAASNQLREIGHGKVHSSF